MGTWQLLPESSEVVAVHAALLPTGEVVYYSGNTGPDVPAQVRVWNPADGSVRTPPNAPDTDLFCSGHALLPDGRLFVCGGTGRYSTGPDDPWGGSKAAYIFDPAGGWERVADMAFGRWYPSVICLPDGRILVASGDDNGVTAQAVERYNPFGGWEVLPPSADRDLPLYPRLHVLPSGEVACAGQGAATAILNLETYEWREVWPAIIGGGSGLDAGGAGRAGAAPGQQGRHAGHGEHGGHGPGGPGQGEGHPPGAGGHGGHGGHGEPGGGTGVIVGPHHHPPGSAGPRPDDLAVLLPPAWGGKVLNAGGGNPAGTDEARIFDFAVPEAGWRTIGPMAHPRWFPNSALLPDGTLFVVGGGRFYNSDPVMEPELFDPETEAWRQDAPMEVPRLYHSTALLLPDGRVWVAGTDGETRMEAYSPDYLAAGPRPVLYAAPQSVAYGQGFPVPMADAGDVAAVCFIRLSSVTHAFNTEQRYIPLGFAVTGPEEIQITAPDSAAVAPPGHYMLFIRNGAGVPAFAPIVQLVAVPADAGPGAPPIVDEGGVVVIPEEPLPEEPLPEEPLPEEPILDELPGEGEPGEEPLPEEPLPEEPPGEGEPGEPPGEDVPGEPGEEPPGEGDPGEPPPEEPPGEGDPGESPPEEPVPGEGEPPGEEPPPEEEPGGA
jgi:hypothetical protein